MRLCACAPVCQPTPPSPDGDRRHVTYITSHRTESKKEPPRHNYGVTAPQHHSQISATSPPLHHTAAVCALH